MAGVYFPLGFCFLRLSIAELAPSAERAPPAAALAAVAATIAANATATFANILTALARLGNSALGSNSPFGSSAAPLFLGALPAILLSSASFGHTVDKINVFPPLPPNVLSLLFSRLPKPD